MRLWIHSHELIARQVSNLFIPVVDVSFKETHFSASYLTSLNEQQITDELIELQEDLRPHGIVIEHRIAHRRVPDQKTLASFLKLLQRPQNKAVSRHFDTLLSIKLVEAYLNRDVDVAIYMAEVAHQFFEMLDPRLQINVGYIYFALGKYERGFRVLRSRDERPRFQGQAFWIVGI